LFLEGNNAAQWEESKLWLKAIKKHTPLIRAIQICFCSSHYTKLEIQATQNGKISHQVKGQPFSYVQPLEKCPTIVAGQKIKPELQHVFDDTSQNGLTAEACIQAGDLVSTRSTRLWCSEEAREKLVEAVIWNEMMNGEDGEDDYC
jgi:hypothetical protein